MTSFQASLTDERLARFYRHWSALRAGRLMPMRKDLEPADIKELLPHLVIKQVVGPRFLIRLMGTEVVERSGNLTGRYLDEVGEPGAYRDFVTTVYETVRDGRKPVLSVTDYDTRGGLPKRIQRLSLPFAETGGADVGHVISAVVFSWPQGAQPTAILVDGALPKQQVFAVDDAA